MGETGIKDLAKRSTRLVRPYTKVEEELREGIRTGMWPAGTRLPSRAPLAKQYGVALSTLDRAIMGLVREGIVRVDDRKGTFVVDAAQNAAQADTLPVVQKTLHTVAVLFEHMSGANTVETIPDPWFALVLKTIQSVAQSKGVETVLHNRCSADGDLRPLSDSLRECVDQEADFIVILGMHGIHGTSSNESERIASGAMELLYWYNQEQLPVVCITSRALRQPIPHVFYDLYYEGYRAAEYMLNQGYKRIVFFRTTDEEWVEERIAGCRQAIADFRPSGDNLFSVFPVQPLPGSKEARGVDGAEKCAYELLSNAEIMKPGLAIIAANDDMAFGIIKARLSSDPFPGMTFGLVSFDDQERANMISLSSFRPPLEAMAKEAVAMGIKMANGEPTGLQLRLPSTLSERSSSRPYVG